MDIVERTMGITALANAVACQLDDEDLDILLVYVNQFKDVLGTIAIERALEHKRRKRREDRG